MSIVRPSGSEFKAVAKAVLVSGAAFALLASGCVGQRTSSEPGYSSYVAGQYARSESEVDQAANYFFEALEAAPANAVLLEEAFSLTLTTGRLEEAVSLAESMAAAGVDNGVASMLLALARFNDSSYDDALATLSQARGTGFDSLVAPIVRAWIEAARGDSEAALDALVPLSRISVFEPFHDEHKAYILDFAERWGDAEDAYQNILAGENLRSLQPILSFGAMLQRRGRAEEARTLYSRYIEQLGDNRFLTDALANLEIGEQTDMTTSTPRGALSSALLRAATELSQDNATTPAIIYARLAGFLSPDMDEAHMLIGNLFLVQEKPKLALLAYEEVDSGEDLMRLARMREALARDQLGETETAIAGLREHLVARPDDVDLLGTLGDILRSHERFEESIAEYNLAIANLDEPESADWFLYFTRGISFEQTDQWDKAEADFLEALVLMPDEPQVLNYLGYSWIDRGMNIERAQEMIESAVKQRPNDGFIVDSLGWVQYLLGDYENAVGNLEKAILLEPGDPTINDHLGDAYWMVGRKLEARFQWTHALGMEPEDDVKPVILDKLAVGLEFAQAAHNEEAVN